MKSGNKKPIPYPSIIGSEDRALSLGVSTVDEMRVNGMIIEICDKINQGQTDILDEFKDELKELESRPMVFGYFIDCLFFEDGESEAIINYLTDSDLLEDFVKNLNVPDLTGIKEDWVAREILKKIIINPNMNFENFLQEYFSVLCDIKRKISQINKDLGSSSNSLVVTHPKLNQFIVGILCSQIDRIKADALTSEGRAASIVNVLDMLFKQYENNDVIKKELLKFVAYSTTRLCNKDDKQEIASQLIRDYCWGVLRKYEVINYGYGEENLVSLMMSGLSGAALNNATLSDIDALTQDGTLLSAAFKANNLDLCQKIIERGKSLCAQANIEISDADLFGQTFIYCYQESENNVNLFKYLVDENKMVPDAKHLIYCCDFASGRNTEILEYLLNQGLHNQLNKDQKECIDKAVLHKTNFKLLIDKFKKADLEKRIDKLHQVASEAGCRFDNARSAFYHNRTQLYKIDLGEPLSEEKISAIKALVIRKNDEAKKQNEIQAKRKLREKLNSEYHKIELLILKLNKVVGEEDLDLKKLQELQKKDFPQFSEEDLENFQNAISGCKDLGVEVSDQDFKDYQAQKQQIKDLEELRKKLEPEYLTIEVLIFKLEEKLAKNNEIKSKTRQITEENKKINAVLSNLNQFKNKDYLTSTILELREFSQIIKQCEDYGIKVSSQDKENYLKAKAIREKGDEIEKNLQKVKLQNHIALYIDRLISVIRKSKNPAADIFEIVVEFCNDSKIKKPSTKETVNDLVEFIYEKAGDEFDAIKKQVAQINLEEIEYKKRHILDHLQKSFSQKIAPVPNSVLDEIAQFSQFDNYSIFNARLDFFNQPLEEKPTPYPKINNCDLFAKYAKTPTR